MTRTHVNPVRRQSASLRKGVAAVEFAVIAPVMFLVVLGIIEFGRAFMVLQVITQAAREGARNAVVDGATNSLVKQRTEQFLQQAGGIGPADVTITISVGNPDAGGQVANAKTGDDCTVKVAIPFSKVQYLAATFLGDSILKSQITMRHE